jgi:hypothetical protein
MKTTVSTCVGILAVLFCLFVGLTEVTDAVPIFNATTGHWYDLVSSGSNGAWINAENNAISLGGHLVTINDVNEEAWLRTTFGNTTRFWIGFNDSAVEGTWVWSSGEAVTYTNWGPGEPNDSMPPPIGEDYAVLNWLSSGEWNDWDHQRPDYYYIDGIAEFDQNPIPEPTTICLIGFGLLGILGVVIKQRRKEK